MTVDNNNVLRILKFLREIFIIPDTMDELFSVNNGMELSGLDADYFLEKFIEKFHVDMSGFDYNRYFYEEGECLTINPLKWFKPLPKKPDLTVRHLARVLEVGRWIEE